MTLPNPTPVPSGITFIDIPASNYRSRNGELPIAVVIHIAEGDKAGVIATFKDPSIEKSSHFLVCKDGSIIQFVSTKNASYCNGNVDNPVNELVLGSTTNPNGWTITIEHEGFATQDITPAQYATTSKIVKYCHDAWNIPMDRTHVMGHREIFSQKTCPGLINVDKIIQLARKL